MRSVMRTIRLLIVVFIILLVLDALSGGDMLKRVVSELHKPATFLKDTRQEIHNSVIQK
jgi:hypothetical protein